MSLVNDMLRDLEQRKDQRRKPGIPLTASARSEQPRTRWGLLAALVLFLGGAAAWLLLWEPEVPEVKPRGRVAVPAPAVTAAPPQAGPVSKAVPSAAAEQTAGQAPAPAGKQAAEPVRISALRWNQRGEQLRLELEAGAPLRFQLRRVDSRSLVLALPAAEAGELTLPAAPTGISLSLAREENDLLLRLESREPVNFVARREPAGLRVALQPLPRPAAAPKAEAGAAKKRADKPEPQPPGGETPAEVVRSSEQRKREPAPAAAQAEKRPQLAKKPRLTPEAADEQQAAAAVALLRKGAQDEAERQLGDFVRSQADAPRSRALLATLLLTRNRADLAAPLVDEGLALRPADAGLRKLKARMLIQQGAPGEAAALLGPDAPPVAADPEYHQLRAVAHQSAGDYPAAAADYRALLATDPARGAWWLGLAIALEAGGQGKAAAEAYRNLLRIPGVEARLRDYARRRLNRLGG